MEEFHYLPRSQRQANFDLRPALYLKRFSAIGNSSTISLRDIKLQFRSDGRKRRDSSARTSFLPHGLLCPPHTARILPASRRSPPDRWGTPGEKLTCGRTLTLKISLSHDCFS